MDNTKTRDMAKKKTPWYNEAGRTLVIVVRSAMFLAVIACTDKIVWMDHPPEIFKGKFYQVSDDIALGIDPPIVVEITNDFFSIKQDSTEFLLGSTGRYSILKVSQDDENSIVVFCTEVDDSRIYEHRYELRYDLKNFLTIHEVVGTGTNSDNEKFRIGKFTNNDYLNKLLVK